MAAHRVATLAAAVLVAASGCTGSVSENGPLSAGGEAASVCGPGDGEAIFSMGHDWLVNEADAPVTITGVELIGAEDMELIEAVILPPPVDPSTTTLIGLVDEYPPAEYTETSDGGSYWSLREDIGKAVIEGHQASNLLIGIKATGHASMEGAAISYQHQGKSYRMETTTRFHVRPQCGGAD